MRGLAIALGAALAAVGAAAEPPAVHYHFDVGAPPAAPERAASVPALGGRDGSALSSLSRTASIAWEQQPVGRGFVAVFVRSISVDYGLSQRVFVARELPEGGCAYQAAWNRERARARAGAKLFARSLPGLQTDVDRAVLALRLPTAATPAVIETRAAETLRTAAAERLQDLIEARAAALQARFAAADAPTMDSPTAAVTCRPAEGLSASARPLEGEAQASLLVP